MLAHLQARCGGRADLAVERTFGRAGGGSLPLLEIPSHAVAVTPAGGDVAALAAALRAAPLPVVGRLTDERLLLDVLALDEGEFAEVAAMVAWALESASPCGSSAQRSFVGGLTRLDPVQAVGPRPAPQSAAPMTQSTIQRVPRAMPAATSLR